MNYESPAVRYQGGLDDLLHRLLPSFPVARNDGDQRIAKLTTFIDSHDGRIGWDLAHTCRELKLDISGAYAARLFKLSRGLGVREYAKKKRLSAAAELLRTTDLSVKAIAVEFGYRSPPDFTRRFKEQFHLSPTDFRKRALRQGPLFDSADSDSRLPANSLAPKTLPKAEEASCFAEKRKCFPFTPLCFGRSITYAMQTDTTRMRRLATKQQDESNVRFRGTTLFERNR
jgi:AraC-like DNA-binding protein